LSLVDVVALVPLLAGTGLLLGGLWQRRQRLDVTLTRRPWSARVGAFVAGLGLGLLVASVFTFFWWVGDRRGAAYGDAVGCGLGGSRE
jgi:hypothetical protein